MSRVHLACGPEASEERAPSLILGFCYARPLYTKTFLKGSCPGLCLRPRRRTHTGFQESRQMAAKPFRRDCGYCVSPPLRGPQSPLSTGRLSASSTGWSPPAFERLRAPSPRLASVREPLPARFLEAKCETFDAGLRNPVRRGPQQGHLTTAL